MKSTTIDATDKRLLAELQRDATLSLDELGARAGLSRNGCWRRVSRLEEMDVFKGRVALLEPTAVNAKLMVFIAVRTSRHSADWAERFRVAVKDIPEIVGAFRTAGEIDYILQARVPDVAAYDALYQRLIARIDMLDVSATFVMETMKETTEIPLGYA
jgi:Lrp/AsnC family transcriptional regulator, cysteine-sensing transcriptional activator